MSEIHPLYLTVRYQLSEHAYAPRGWSYVACETSLVEAVDMARSDMDAQAKMGGPQPCYYVLTHTWLDGLVVVWSDGGGREAGPFGGSLWADRTSLIQLCRDELADWRDPAHSMRDGDQS